jgi:AAA family ATP:ADP antiporter
MRKKLFFLSTAACFIAASYAILRPLKISLFYQIVGKEYYPLSKIIMALFIVPLVYFYSKIVDSQKKENILYIFLAIYSAASIIFACFFSHPIYGLSNTITSPYRILGWFFSLFMDFYPAFVIGTFWAFINSTSTPEFAKKSYGIIYTFIKIGGITATGLSFLLITKSANKNFFISILVATAGVLTLLAIVVIKKLIAQTPKKEFVGYKAQPSSVTPSPKVFDGFRLLITQPYAFGIFILFYFYEVVFTIVEYQATVKLCNKAGKTKMTSLLFLSATISQIIGVFITFFLTTLLLQKVKIQYVLSVMPIFTLLTIVLLWIFPSVSMLVLAIILLPALHYSINSPARELLFVPTTKEIQFKTKAWIDSFGRTISKTSGSTINMFFYQIPPMLSSSINAVSSIVTIMSWLVVAMLLGKKYNRTIEENSVIGEEAPPR